MTSAMAVPRRRGRRKLHRWLRKLWFTLPLILIVLGLIVAVVVIALG